MPTEQQGGLASSMIQWHKSCCTPPTSHTWRTRGVRGFDFRNPRMSDWFDGDVSELADTLSRTTYDQVVDVLREAQPLVFFMPSKPGKEHNQ